MTTGLTMPIDETMKAALSNLMLSGYGKTIEEVAIYLLRREIDDLARAGVVDKRIGRSLSK